MFNPVKGVHLIYAANTAPSASHFILLDPLSGNPGILFADRSFYGDFLYSCNPAPYRISPSRNPLHSCKKIFHINSKFMGGNAYLKLIGGFYGNLDWNHRLYHISSYGASRLARHRIHDTPHSQGETDCTSFDFSFNLCPRFR